MSATTYLARHIGQASGLCCSPQVIDPLVYMIGRYTSPVLSIYDVNNTEYGPYANLGPGDAIITTFNRSGIFQWAARIGGTGDEQGLGITAAADGSAYATGNYNSSPVTVYNADGSVFGTLDNSGNRDIFLVKYNPGGAVAWATRIAGSQLGTSLKSPVMMVG